MNPGAIAREGYLNGVLSIAVSGYLTVAVVVPPAAVAEITTATTDYVICDRSGFRALPHELVVDPYSGNMVLPKYRDIDHEQTSPTRSSFKKGQLRAEQDNTFLLGTGYNFIQLQDESGFVEVQTNTSGEPHNALLQTDVSGLVLAGDL